MLAPFANTHHDPHTCATVRPLGLDMLGLRCAPTRMQELRELITACWAQKPEDRPSFVQVRATGNPARSMWSARKRCLEFGQM